MEELTEEPVDEYFARSVEYNTEVDSHVARNHAIAKTRTSDDGAT